MFYYNNLYIYIKPKLLKLSQFSTSVFFFLFFKFIKFDAFFFLFFKFIKFDLK